MRTSEGPAPATGTGPTMITPATEALGVESTVPGAQFLAAALAFASAGVYVFPVRPGDKKPLGSCTQCRSDPPCVGPQQCGHDHCHGCKDATVNEARIATWWSRWPAANIGVATGPSRLAVVDMDGPAGIAEWRALVDEHGAPRTLTVSTPSGGAHLWYRARPDRACPNSVKRLSVSIDTRGTPNGYVVAPPSMRPDGVYRWQHVPDRVDALPEIPNWILDKLNPPRREPAPAAARPVVEGMSDAYLRKAVTGELDRVLGAACGGRNHALNRTAFSLGQLVGAGLLDRAAVVTALAQAAEHVGLGDREADRSISSGLNAGIRKPRRGVA